MEENYEKENITCIVIDKDLETGEKCGALRTFQICNVFGYDTEGNEYNLNKYIHRGNHFLTDEEVLNYLKSSCRDYNFNDFVIE